MCELSHIRGRVTSSLDLRAVNEDQKTDFIICILLLIFFPREVEGFIMRDNCDFLPDIGEQFSSVMMILSIT